MPPSSPFQRMSIGLDPLRTRSVMSRPLGQAPHGLVSSSLRTSPCDISPPPAPFLTKPPALDRYRPHLSNGCSYVSIGRVFRLLWRPHCCASPSWVPPAPLSWLCTQTLLVRSSDVECPWSASCLDTEVVLSCCPLWQPAVSRSSQASRLSSPELPSGPLRAPGMQCAAPHHVCHFWHLPDVWDVLWVS